MLAHLDGWSDDELLLLAEQLSRERFSLEVVVCLRTDARAATSRLLLDRLGVPVHAAPDHLSLEDTASYLSDIFPRYDVVLTYQDPPDVPLALAQLAVRPPVVARDALTHAGSIVPRVTGRVIPAWSAAVEAVAADHRRRREADRDATLARTPFASELWGGFECSTHRRGDGRRVDVVAATAHDRLAREDYAQLRELGICTVRDGVRWHLLEPEDGGWVPDSLLSQLAGARSVGAQVVWDLLHYGWPDHVDVWAPDFPARFAEFATRVARLVGPGGFYAPVNEISFLAWAGGEVGYLNPFAHQRGLELKVQLVRATLAATAAVREIDPGARFLQPEPLIHVAAADGAPQDVRDAELHRRLQHQALDMLTGRAWPQLGGTPDQLDVVGANYYPANQWEHGGGTLPAGDPRRRPLGQLLLSLHARYGRPVVVAETGTEGDDRAGWLTEVVREVRWARERGVPVLGVCLYPVLGHPGWDDDRYCPNGLLELSASTSPRPVHEPLERVVREVRRSGLGLRDTRVLGNVERVRIAHQ